MSGRLFIVSGPSGAGKSSLCTAWLERDPNLALSISCTTRKPRPGDVDGEHYHFLSEEEFRRQVEAGAFLEWAEVHGNLYGTRREDVERLLAQGRDVLLEIDWQGAEQVAQRMERVCRIFILPPSMEELRRRLIRRGHDSEEVMAQRLAAAEEEMAHADEAHHVLINDDFSRSLERLLALSRGDGAAGGGDG
ncbi:MAG: guanylate kinase [Zetaproteobacteria bacterium]|nr:MAG: guanylate kinase [Zetaproteobacteria bacterium]